MIAFALSQKGLLEVGSSDSAFASMVAKLLPQGITGIVVCGLLAALMSSLASLFNSSAMLFVEDFYNNNSSLISIKFRVYDLVLLTLVLPLSVVMFFIARTGRVWAKEFVLGILIYLAFSYGLNVFNCYQNQLFIIYIAIFSLCVFSTIIGFSDIAKSIKKPSALKLLKVISIVLFFNAISGYGLWLSDAVEALIKGEVSQTIAGMNLPTNVAQVLDIGFMLPLAIVGAIKLWKYQSDGMVISAMMLVFFMLIGISVVSMEFGLMINGLEMDPSKVYGFGTVTLISTIMTVFIFRALLKMTR
jgi:Na+/proline symporter